MLTTHFLTDRKGHIAALGLCCCNLVLSLVLRWYFGFLNTKKDMRRHTDEANRQRQESFEELGDSHPGEFQLFSHCLSIYLLTELPTIDFYYTA